MRALLVCFAGAALIACDDGAATPDGGARPDLALDALPGDDTGGMVDAMPDAMPDVMADAMLDAAIDATPDATADLDMAPDAAVEPDAGPDAEPFADSSPVRDASGEPDPPCVLFECACVPGERVACYVGPPATEGVGICLGGEQTCLPDGSRFGPCAGHQPPLGENCLTAADEDCDGATPPCAEGWQKVYADDAAQAVRAVAVAAEGDVVALIDYDRTINAGAGPITARGDDPDLAVARYDRLGNPVWSHVFGDADADFAVDLAITADDGVIVVGRLYGGARVDGAWLSGHGQDDVLVVALDAAGQVRWSRLYGGPLRDVAERVAVGPGGEVVVIGRFEGSLQVGPHRLQSLGLGDVFAFALDGETGEPRWARAIGGAGADTGHGVAVGPDGTTYVAGRFEQIVGFGGAPVESAGAGDLFVLALGPDGGTRWARVLAGPGDAGVYDLAFDPTAAPADGPLVLFGWFADGLELGAGRIESAGGRDLVVARLDLDGAVTLARPFGDAADQLDNPFPQTSSAAMALGPDGRIVLAGPIAGGAFGEVEDADGPARDPLVSAGGVDGYVVRLSPRLRVEAGRIFGAGFTEMALGVALDGEAVVVGGRFFSLSLDLGLGAPLRGAAQSDGFVVRWPGL